MLERTITSKDKNYDFRIIIIDDNPEIHHDFIQTLTGLDTFEQLDSLQKKLFGKTYDTRKLKISSQSATMLPRFEIDTATQGEEGVRKIKEASQQGKPYALAFVDIRMPPGWDGIETIKHIWELDKDMQIVICTAYSDYSWEQTVEELGQSDNLLILKKPFDQIAVRQLAYALTRKWDLVQDNRNYTESLENTIDKRTEELKFQVTHDALTGLPNRVLLEEKLKEAITSFEQSNKKFALLFVDLDRFKLINDSLSHTAGDQLLKTMADRLRKHLPHSVLCARLGGDEFILLAREIGGIDEAKQFAMNLLNIIAEPFEILGHKLYINASIGISVYENGIKMDDMIRNADLAMYKSKEQGGHQFKIYTREMSDECVREMVLETELRKAIAEGEFELFYQPQIDLKSNKIVAVEALIRWRHPQKGLLLPLDFIPLAEETGLIVPIGEMVLRKACEQNKAWQNEGILPIRIAVNITTPQIRHFNFVQSVDQILKETKLDPKYLELELTENTIINNKHAMKVIGQLKEMGICIALDDFGTGYSCLNYLRNVPLDRLKIDRSFVQNILINRGDEVVLQAIIAMAKGLNLEVLAEGVETQHQLDFLKSQNCMEIQGFYFSHPVTSKELKQLLQSKSEIKMRE